MKVIKTGKVPSPPRHPEGYTPTGHQFVCKNCKACFEVEPTDDIILTADDRCTHVPAVYCTECNELTFVGWYYQQCHTSDEWDALGRCFGEMPSVRQWTMQELVGV